MRTYGRIALNPLTPDVLTWVEVDTDANGYNDYVWLTTLIQCFKLNLGESPFWGDWGIPAKPSVVQQVFPDYYVALMQQRFAQYFAALIIAKIPGSVPTYQVNATTHQGAKFQMTVAT